MYASLRDVTSDKLQGFVMEQ